MDYETFKEKFVEDLKDKLYEQGAEVNVSVHNVNKLNESYEAVTVTPEGSNIGVNIPIDKFYDAIESGKTYDEVVDKAVDVVTNGISQRPDFDIDSLSDYSQMKEKLAMEVVSAEANKEMLETVPHQNMEDMAVVYRFVLSSDDEGRASILVTNQLLENMGVTPEQLHADAMENAPQIKPVEIKGMSEVMAEMMGVEQAEMMGLFPVAPEDAKIFVATVPDKVHGAGVLAYQNFMDQAAERAGGDFYILPSSMNMATDVEDFRTGIAIPHKKDEYNGVRDEYSSMLFHQMEAGNNGLTKTKYLTFGIHADSIKAAKPRIIHIETDILNNFKRLGVQARVLNGKERLALMHQQFHMGDKERFHFDWKYLLGTGLSVKDFIAPSSFSFPTGKRFTMGSLYGAMSFLSIDASDISDRMLADFLNMESSQIVNMHIQSVDQNEAIKTVKHTITELDRSKIEEQNKAVRAGYDMDIIPSDLATFGKDAKALLKELQSQNERMFLLTFRIMNTRRTEQELENNVFQAKSIAQKHNCNLVRLDFQQEQGLMSSLPLANNLIEIHRGMTTSSTAIFVPFTTQELFQSGDESLYYGLNALSNNLIMVDRKLLKNPNGLILGTPGSGKSFAAKREIANAFLVTDDDVIISDPEAEYSPLVERFGGQVIKIAPTSTQYINPMDINMNYSDDDNPIALKADFILSLCELIVGGKEGLQPVEKTVIDRCIHQIYQKYFEDPRPEKMPLLEDLYNALLKQDEPEARHVATALEIYVSGSLNNNNN